MNASALLRKRMAELLAADTATLAKAADANKVVLVAGAFASNEDLDLDSLTLASFDGGTPKLLALDEQFCGIDPLTGDSILSLVPPAGGFRWETTGTTNLPQTIYGVIVTNNAGDELYGSHIFRTPVSLTIAGQVIAIDALTLRVPTASLHE